MPDWLVPIYDNVLYHMLELDFPRPPMVRLPMNLTLHIPDDLATRLTAAGANPEHPALEALRHAADEIEHGSRRPSEITADAEMRRAAARAAAERMKKRRKGVTLGGLTIKELINEGRP